MSPPGRQVGLFLEARVFSNRISAGGAVFQHIPGDHGAGPIHYIVLRYQPLFVGRLWCGWGSGFAVLNLLPFSGEAKPSLRPIQAPSACTPVIRRGVLVLGFGAPGEEWQAAGRLVHRQPLVFRAGVALARL
jgi:hypothetical protein